MDYPPSREELGFHRPSIARMYNHYLGGKAAFKVDREAAEAVIRAVPDMPVVARENFLFAGRAAAYAAREHHIEEFLDIGTGIVDDIPLDSVEKRIHAITPDARVVAIDNDPIVLSHAKGLRPGCAGVLGGDIADPGSVLDHPYLDDLIDFRTSVGVVLAAVLHFVECPVQVMAALRRRLAPGSVVMLSHVTSSGVEQSRMAEIAKAYEPASGTICFRSEEEILALVDGWDLIDPPGLCDVAAWGFPEPRSGRLGKHVRTVGLVAVRPGGHPDGKEKQ